LSGSNEQRPRDAAVVALRQAKIPVDSPGQMNTPIVRFKWPRLACRPLEQRGDVPQRQVWFGVAAGRLPSGQCDVPGGERLVRDLAQQVVDDVEPAALLVVGVRDVPGAHPVSVAANIASLAPE